MAKKLIETFWPGPLSLVLKKRSVVPDIVTAGLDSVAVRCPLNSVARELIEAAATPVAAPSANRFGMVSPTTAQHVSDQFGDQLTHILDDGPCEVGVESTVVSFAEPDSGPVLLRPGGITCEQIESVIGPLPAHLHEDSKPTSPGQLLRHYSPRTPLYLANDPDLLAARSKKSKVGLLAFQGSPQTENYSAVEVLSETGCHREAATRLFAALRRLDDKGLDLIVAEEVEEIGLGHAIMDRLKRAATK